MGAGSLGDFFHTFLLGQVLPYESVHVFVTAPLPGVIGIGKVKLDSSPPLYLPVTMEFRAVIAGDGMYLLTVLTDKLYCSLLRGFLRFIG